VGEKRKSSAVCKQQHEFFLPNIRKKYHASTSMIFAKMSQFSMEAKFISKVRHANLV
jgi:hypothetical protein